MRKFVNDGSGACGRNGYGDDVTENGAGAEETPLVGVVSLMGLEIPSAAIAWAFAVSQSHLVVVSTPWLYQFLFVAVWCVNMLDRVLKIFRGGPAAYSDECLLFAKKHCFVISLLIVVAAVTGLWIMFFQLGVVIFQFALLPGICSLLFLYFSSNPHKKGSLSSGFVMASFFAAVSFSTGAGIPAYFYGTMGGGWGASCPRPPGISSPWSSSACSAANGGMKKRRKTGRTPPPGTWFPWSGWG